MQLVLVYLQPLRRNSLLKCAWQLEIAKNSLKPFILGIQGDLRSSMLTFVRSPSPVLVMIGSISVPICNHFYVRRANTGKITSFRWGAPRSWGPPWPRGMKFCPKILENLGYHTVKTRSLYLIWAWNDTGTWHQDRQTNEQNYRS